MSTLGVVELIVGLAALAAAVYFFGVPWIAPLYARYREFVERKALGK